MTGNIAARRYARALFSLGRQKGLPELEKFGADLAVLRSALELSPDLAKVFRTPAFSADEKQRLVGALAKKLDLGLPVRNFCLLLADKDRLAQLSAIADVYKELLDAEKGVLRGELITAVELDAGKRGALLEQLEKKAGRKLELSFAVDSSVLGGVLLKVGDRVMDASLRAQLSILKDNIKRGE